MLLFLLLCRVAPPSVSAKFDEGRWSGRHGLQPDPRLHVTSHDARCPAAGRQPSEWAETVIVRETSCGARRPDRVGVRGRAPAVAAERQGERAAWPGSRCRRRRRRGVVDRDRGALRARDGPRDHTSVPGWENGRVRRAVHRAGGLLDDAEARDLRLDATGRGSRCPPLFDPPWIHRCVDGRGVRRSGRRDGGGGRRRGGRGVGAAGAVEAAAVAAAGATSGPSRRGHRMRRGPGSPRRRGLRGRRCARGGTSGLRGAERVGTVCAGLAAHAVAARVDRSRLRRQARARPPRPPAAAPPPPRGTSTPAPPRPRPAARLGDPAQSLGRGGRGRPPAGPVPPHPGDVGEQLLDGPRITRGDVRGAPTVERAQPGQHRRIPDLDAAAADELAQHGRADAQHAGEPGLGDAQPGGEQAHPVTQRRAVELTLPRPVDPQPPPPCPDADSRSPAPEGV